MLKVKFVKGHSVVLLRELGVDTICFNDENKQKYTIITTITTTKHKTHAQSKLKFSKMTFFKEGRSS